MRNQDAYHAICKLKKTQIFCFIHERSAILSKKKAKPETNPKSIVLKEYHDLLNVFYKKNSDTFLVLYQKYNYKVILKKEHMHGYDLFYKMLPKELNTVKCYLHLYFC